MEKGLNFYAIDITRQYRRIKKQRIATGIDKVDLEYIREFQVHALALIRIKASWYILTKPDSQAVFKALLANCPLSKIKIALYLSKTKLTRTPHKLILINTSHSGLEQDSYASIAKKYFSKVVYFIHDLIPLEFPEYCREGELQKHQQRLKTVFQSADLVIVNSSDTQSKLENYARQYQASVNCMTAMLGSNYLLASTPSESFAKRPAENYFVVLGTIEPRKNHLLLLLVWRRLSEILKENCPKLYIVGKRGWDVEQVIDILERAPYAQKNIIEISNACDQQVIEILKNSKALLFPSFVEGFGLPLVEALQLSTPVIASNLAVFKELAGDIPDYADPIDVMQWLKIIINYSSDDSTMRTAQLNRLSNFRAFSWEEHFKIVTPQLNHLFIS